MASIRALVLCGLLFTSLNISAKTTPADCKQPTEVEVQADTIMKVLPPPAPGCADGSKLMGICNSIYQDFDAPEGSPFSLKWEHQIHEAACALGDTKEVAAVKIQKMWQKLENTHLVCTQGNFEVDKGSILKYAISLPNWRFLSKAVEKWKVNLNKVDPSDNRTPLDYIEWQMKIAENNPETMTGLKRAYEQLRKFGAKHRREL